MASLTNQCLGISEPSAAYSEDAMAFPELDPSYLQGDLEARVSGGKDFSEMNTEDGPRVSKSKVSGGGSGVADAGIGHLGTDRDGSSTKRMHGFKIGDMVWGKVKSHPWWPGRLFNEAFASSSAHITKIEGHVLVSFFGDNSYGWFHPSDLIPYEAHFVEKSKQSKSSNFIDAVEESVDELNRRGALALACCCKNPSNFRQTSVPNFISVDVAGFEPGEIYSADQINKARESFQPVEVLSFLHHLAVMPRKRSLPKSVDWIRRTALLVAYRRAVFEEFDDTYAQAFGVQPLRPSEEPLGVKDASDNNKSSHQALLMSDSLMTTELSAERKNANEPKPKLKNDSSAKKKRNLMKRRDETPSSTAPIARLPKKPYKAPISKYQVSSSAKVGNHEKREDGEANEFSLQKVGNTELKASNRNCVELSSSERKLVKEKVLKRLRKELEFDKTDDIGERKKKSVKGRKAFHISGNRESLKKSTESFGTGFSYEEQFKVLNPSQYSAAAQTKEDQGSAELNLEQVVSDMLALAVDPCTGTDQNAPMVVSLVFPKSRSLVYEQVPASLLLFSEPDKPSGSENSEAKEAREQKELSSALKPIKPTPKASEVINQRGSSSTLNSSKPILKFGDLTKTTDRKRSFSGRQEETPVKRIKNPNQLKALAAAKRASSGQKTLEGMQHGDQKEKVVASVALAKTNKSDNIKKQEPLPKPKPSTPTFLIMNFPPKSVLPSGSELKARFAQFGPMEPSETRVYWNSLTCKVLFKYKSDAEAARNSIKNNHLFGQVKVNSHLREVKAPEQSEVGKHQADHRQSDECKSGNGGSVSSQEPRQHPAKLKSCLKKPADELGSQGNGVEKKSHRVRLLLEPLTVIPSSENVTANPKSANSPLPPPPPPPRPHRPQATPPLPPQILETEMAGRERSWEEFSRQMLGLLLRCSDIVNAVKAASGYVPYHPL